MVPAAADRRFVAAAACALLTAVPAAAASQTILNTERFQIQEVTGPHLSADVSLSLRRGNAEVLNVSTAGMTGVVSERHWPRLIFGGRYLSNEDRSILDDQFLQLRYSYLLSRRTRTFHFVQVQKNQTLLLESRWLLGSGIRTTLAENERSSLSLGTGLMAERERLDEDRVDPGEPGTESTIRVANLAVISWTSPTGARLLNILYFQPKLSGFGDSRVLNDLGLSMPLSDAFRATISLEWRLDTRPPAALSRHDLSLTAGFGMDIS